MWGRDKKANAVKTLEVQCMVSIGQAKRSSIHQSGGEHQKRTVAVLFG